MRLAVSIALTHKTMALGGETRKVEDGNLRKLFLSVREMLLQLLVAVAPGRGRRWRECSLEDREPKVLAGLRGQEEMQAEEWS